jgi:hypothetical protein
MGLILVDDYFVFGSKEIFDVSIGRNGNLGKVYLVVGPLQALTVFSGLHGIDTLFVGKFDRHIIVAAEVNENFLFLLDEARRVYFSWQPEHFSHPMLAEPTAIIPN